MHVGRNPSIGWFLSLLLVVALPAAANSNNRIHQVRLSQESGLTVVEIAGEHAPNFTTFKQNTPNRVVVDMAECSLTGVPKQIVGDGKLVDTISTAQLVGGARTVSRVVISVSREVEYRVTARGGSLFIYLSPGTGGLLVSAGVPLAPEREPVEPIVSKTPSTASPPTTLSLPIDEGTKPFKVAMVTADERAARFDREAETVREPKLVPIPIQEPQPVPVVASKPAPVTETKSKPHSVAEPKPVPVSERAPVPAVESKPAATPEPKPAQAVEPKPAPLPESRSQSVVEPKPVPVPEPTAAPVIEKKPVLLPEPRVAPVIEKKPVLLPEPTVAPVIETKPVVVPKPKPEPVLVSAPQPMPVFESNPVPIPETKLTPVVAPKPTPVVLSKPAPVPEPESQLVAHLSPSPEPKPVVETKPVNVVQSNPTPAKKATVEVASIAPRPTDSRAALSVTSEKRTREIPIDKPIIEPDSVAETDEADVPSSDDMADEDPAPSTVRDEEVEKVREPPPPPPQARTQELSKPLKLKGDETPYQKPKAAEFVSRVDISRATKKMTWLGFQQTQDSSQVFIKTNEPVRYRVIEETDHLVIVELENTKIPKRNDRRFLDTHFFNTAVSMITPREVSGLEHTVRVEIQLKDRVPYTTGQESNVVFIRFQLPK